MVALGYTCWMIDSIERNALLAQFPPEYVNTIAHHVTLDYGVPQDHPLPTELFGRIVGDAFRDGVQALVVDINGSLFRPDGAIYHITWSLAENRFPEDSNKLLAGGLCSGWFPHDVPTVIKLTPAWVMSRPK